MENYYTAREAAQVLGLKYPAFLARVRKDQYPFETFGNTKAFLKSMIDKASINAADSQPVETSTR